MDGLVAEDAVQVMEEGVFAFEVPEAGSVNIDCFLLF
jgi:hypothetical protein